MARIVDKDKGLKRITTDIKALGDYKIKMGIMGDQTVDGVSVVDYAMYNEFGTSTIPARPFMETTFTKHGDELVKMAQYLAGDMIDGKIKPKKVLDTLGLWYTNKIKMTIRDAKNWAVPNAASTVAQKGSSSPLIDNGRMLGAVNYEIEKD